MAIWLDVLLLLDLFLLFLGTSFSLSDLKRDHHEWGSKMNREGESEMGYVFGMCILAREKESQYVFVCCVCLI